MSQLKQKLAALPWQSARTGVAVKLLPEAGEIYVLTESQDRIRKERVMRWRQLKWLWQRLGELTGMELKRDAWWLKLGAAKQRALSAGRLVQVDVPQNGDQLQFSLRKDKLRGVRKAEGRYLLRTNLTESDPAQWWEFYIPLTHVAEAFKNLQGDLALRPIFHRKEERI